MILSTGKDLLSIKIFNNNLFDTIKKTYEIFTK